MRGFLSYRETRTPSPHPSPLQGEGADRACRANCTSTGRELGRDYREKQAPASPNSHRREDVRELGLEPRAEIVAHVDRDREGPFELHVVGDAGVDQDAVVEVARQEQWVALRCPRLLDD